MIGTIEADAFTNPDKAQQEALAEQTESGGKARLDVVYDGYMASVSFPHHAAEKDGQDGRTKRNHRPLPRDAPASQGEHTPDQEEKYLWPAIRGEKTSAFAQTEPQSGSDPGNMMQTRAVKDGDDWVINGTKMFVSGAPTADYMML